VRKRYDRNRMAVIEDEWLARQHQQHTASIAATYYYGEATVPAGTNGMVQFNDNGAFGGEEAFGRLSGVASIYPQDIGKNIAAENAKIDQEQAGFEKELRRLIQRKGKNPDQWAQGDPDKAWMDARVAELVRRRVELTMKADEALPYYRLKLPGT